MTAGKLSTAPADMRTEWRRLNDVIDDVNILSRVSSAQPHLVSVSVSDAGVVLDFSGLISALATKNIDLTAL
jgi:hypothetical protein